MHISTHMLTVYSDHNMYWYVDDGFGNLIPVSTAACRAGNYSFAEIVDNFYWAKEIIWHE